MPPDEPRFYRRLNYRASTATQHHAPLSSPVGIAPRTVFLASELYTTVVNATRAYDERLNSSLSTRYDHAGKQSQALWTHDHFLPKLTIYVEHFTTLVQPPVDKLPHRELTSNDSRYAQSTSAGKARLVTTPAELD